jgi:Helicase associated domain
VQQQRHRHKKGKLKKEYFDLLTNLQFEWNPDLKKENNTQWLTNYQKLIDYKNKFGTIKVSQTDKTYRALGRWVNDQRVGFKRNKLSDFKIEKLNKIEFIWDGRIN